MPDTTLVKRLMADLEREPRIDLHHYPIQADIHDGALILEGTVAHIAAKRLARLLAHRHADTVLDLLRVAIAEPEGAGQLRDEVITLLQEEQNLQACGLSLRDGDQRHMLREGESGIEVATDAGTVTLSGTVPSLSQRRLAEVLAWWTAGCERVDNRLHVVPPERETDGELADAVQLILTKDPLIHGDRLAVTVREGVVTLAGIASSDEERYLATQDVWYIPGVRDVVDHIVVL